MKTFAQDWGEAVGRGGRGECSGLHGYNHMGQHNVIFVFEFDLFSLRLNLTTRRSCLGLWMSSMGGGGHREGRHSTGWEGRAGQT